MNDFFLATNRSIKIPVLGNDVEVRQIQMKDFGWCIKKYAKKKQVEF